MCNDQTMRFACDFVLVLWARRWLSVYWWFMADGQCKVNHLFKQPHLSMMNALIWTHIDKKTHGTMIRSNTQHTLALWLFLGNIFIERTLLKQHLCFSKLTQIFFFIFLFPTLETVEGLTGDCSIAVRPQFVILVFTVFVLFFIVALAVCHWIFGVTGFFFITTLFSDQKLLCMSSTSKFTTLTGLFSSPQRT